MAIKAIVSQEKTNSTCWGIPLASRNIEKYREVSEDEEHQDGEEKPSGAGEL